MQKILKYRTHPVYELQEQNQQYIVSENFQKISVMDITSSAAIEVID